MIKSISILTRKDGMTREEFNRAWAEEHAPMAKGVPGLKRYTLSFVTAERSRPDIPDQPVTADGIAELWYDSLEDMQKAAASPEMKKLTAHGATFIGSIKMFTTEEKVIIGD